MAAATIEKAAAMTAMMMTMTRKKDDGVAMSKTEKKLKGTGKPLNSYGNKSMN